MGVGNDFGRQRRAGAIAGAVRDWPLPSTALDEARAHEAYGLSSLGGELLEIGQEPGRIHIVLIAAS